MWTDAMRVDASELGESMQSKQELDVTLGSMFLNADHRSGCFTYGDDPLIWSRSLCIVTDFLFTSCIDSWLLLIVGVQPFVLQLTTHRVMYIFCTVRRVTSQSGESFIENKEKSF